MGPPNNSYPQQMALPLLLGGSGHGQQGSGGAPAGNKYVGGNIGGMNGGKGGGGGPQSHYQSSIYGGNPNQKKNTGYNNWN